MTKTMTPPSRTTNAGHVAGAVRSSSVTRRRLRHGAVLLLTCGLALSACSSGDSGASDPTAAPDAETAPTVEGELQEVSVASVVLPAPGPWTGGPGAATEALDESTFTLTPGDSTAPTCSVVLSVESDFEGSMDSYRTFLTALNGDAVEITDDSDAPAGTEGVVARVDRREDSGNPFTSLIRSWITSGGTKITLSVVAPGESPAAECDAERIASTLRWDGAERESR